MQKTEFVIVTEDQAVYRALCDRYYGQFAPITEDERTLVDILISSEWLRRRCLRVEADIWNVMLENKSLGDAYASAGDTLARLDRRLNSAIRTYTHALKQLRTIVSKRPTPAVSAQDGRKSSSGLFLVSERKIAA